MRISSSETSLQSNAKGDSIDFSIGDPSVIIEILRNKLYSDKVTVVVQEYLSNARDSMRQAKNETTKILVTLPTRKNPTLVIRDFGTGLSPEQVRNVFVQFGRSTKRENDQQTGGFGLGAKAAWAYTSAYLIISYFNGQETHYVAHIGDKSTGTLQVVHEGPTKSPNGVEIQIGVNESAQATDLVRFHDAYFKTTAFWGDERPELKNPQDAITGSDLWKLWNRAENPAIKTKSVQGIIHDNHFSHYGVFQMVVDGIIYPMPKHDEVTNAVAPYQKMLESRKLNIYLFAGNADVEVSASREALQVGPKTLSGITKIANAGLKELTQYLTDTVNSIKTLKEAAVVGRRLFSFVQPAHLNHVRVIQNVYVDFEGQKLNGSEFVGYYINGVSRKHPKIVESEPRIVADLFIYLDNEVSNNQIKMKMNKWLETNKTGRANVVVIAHGNAKVAADLGAFNISEMQGMAKKAKVAKKDLGEDEVTVKVFDAYSKLRSQVVKKTNPLERYILVTPSAGIANTDFCVLQSVLRRAQSGVTLCFTSEANAKLLENYKGFTSWNKLLENPAVVLTQKTFEDIIRFLKSRIVYATVSWRQELGQFKAKMSEISDPFVTEGLNNYLSFSVDDPIRTVTDTAYYNDIVKLVFPFLTQWQEEAKLFSEQLIAKYPLMIARHGDVDEKILYMNLKYSHNESSKAS
jgi:hypothetical protein